MYKAVKIEGRKSDVYTFEYGNEDIKKQISILDPVKDKSKISELTLKFKYLTYEIQEPTFEQLVASLSELYDNKGRLSLATSGKVIWELCCISYDSLIEENPKLLLLICQRLSEYVLPLDVEIKKK